MVEKTHGGSVWTADHSCGRREAVDESGEQPEGRPKQARDDDTVEETRSLAEDAEGETRGRRKGERQTRQCNGNTLHLVIHLPATTTATATTSTAAAAAATAAVRLS